MSDLPPGYRFYPTEEELLSFYLHNKLHNMREDMERVIPVVQLYSADPWNLPQISGERCIQHSEQWFFFCPRQERESQGGRPNRTTPTGYWKASGSPSLIYSSSNRVIGMKKTMAFYQGRAPTGTKTQWKMNEYKAFEEDPAIPGAAPKLRSEFSLCRVYMKASGRSFDRRPSLAGPSTESHRMARASSSNSEASTAERTTSHDSSSSGDHGPQHPVLGEAMDWKILEELDWD